MTIEKLIDSASRISECFTHFANLTKDRNDRTTFESNQEVLDEVKAVRRYCVHQRKTRDELDDRIYFDNQIEEIDRFLDSPTAGWLLSITN